MVNASSTTQPTAVPTVGQRLTLAILQITFRLFGDWTPIHDSWLPPRTPAARDLLRLRLERLEALKR